MSLCIFCAGHLSRRFLPDRYFPMTRFIFGLDLQGGMHLILEVDADKVGKLAYGKRTAAT